MIILLLGWKRANAIEVCARFPGIECFRLTMWILQIAFEIFDLIIRSA